MNAHSPHHHHHAPAGAPAAARHAAGHDHDDMVGDFRRRFWISLALTVPVLATSEMIQHFFGVRIVGIAIGAGTDVAIESADIVLVRSDPRDVPAIVQLARATYRKMVQNLWWATGYNAVAIPLAAGVLAKAGILLSPALGAVLMSASTVIVALNAQLLGRGRRATSGVY